MRLWVDAQCLQTDSRKRGIGRYVLGLLEAMAAAPRSHALVLSLNAALWESLSEARDQALQLVDRDDIFLWQGAATSGEAVTGYTPERQQSESILSHHVRCLRADVCFTASSVEGRYDAAVPYLNASGPAMPWAALYFDAIPSRFPQHYLVGEFARSCNERWISALTRADALLAISEFSAGEAAQLTGTTRVSSIGSGVSAAFLRAVEERSSSPRGRRRDNATILYVGGLDWRKNVFAAVDAIAKLPADLRDRIRFVCVGEAPASARDHVRSHWVARQLPPYALVMRPFVSDEELIDAYFRATVAIQPSVMEGFGLTVLEAMACGCPVVVSRAGALPELVDCAEALFDPTSSDDIARVIERALRNEELQLALAERGTRRAKLYTWRSCAELAWDRLEMVYESAAAVPALTLQQIREQTKAQLTVIDRTGRLAELLAVAENQHVRTRVYVDITSVSTKDSGTGIQRVAKNITRELLYKPPKSFEVRLALMGNNGEWRVTTGLDRSSSEAVRFAPGDIVLMMDSVWDFIEQQEPLLRRARAVGAEVIFVLYDLIPIHYPAFCDEGVVVAFSNWFKRAVDCADGWLCISKAVADELLSLLSSIGSTASVDVGYWHLGSDHLPNSQPLQTNSPPHNRFLMVGTIEPRKGHSVALAAFEKLWDEGSADELWIAGRRGWHVESLVERIKHHPQYNRKLRWVESPNDDQLASLYRRAAAVILASYAEGFGLPIVEAMRFEKPLIISDLPVFREAAGDSAVYFETGNADALAAAVRRFASQPYVKPDRSRWIDWAESAQQLQRVVLSANWYRRFQPDNDSSLASKRVRTRLLDPNGGSVQGTITLVEAPTLNVKDHMYRTVVQIFNQSAVTWSTSGVPVGAAGITIGCRLIDANGDMVPIVLPDAKIPLAIGPGTCLVAALSTPKTVLQYGSRIRIGVVQRDQWSPWFVDVDLPR